MTDKRILLICGSNNDLISGGEPSEFVNGFLKAVDTWNTSDHKFKLSFTIESCSADRTPFLLPAILFSKEM